MDPYYEDMKSSMKAFRQLEAVADGGYGIPKKCPCGAPIIHEMLAEKRFFTCQVFQNDGFHLRKAWDRSMEEEVEKLTREVDENTKRWRDMANHKFLIGQIQLELKKKDEEIAILKEDVARFMGAFNKFCKDMSLKQKK